MTTGSFCPAVVVGTTTSAVLVYPVGSCGQVCSIVSWNLLPDPPGLGTVGPGAPVVPEPAVVPGGQRKI